MLIKSDYYSFIQADILDLIIEGNEQNRTNAENAALETVRSYLSGRYNMQLALPGSSDYSAGTSYSVGALVVYNSKIYTAKASTTGNLPTNTTFWVEGDASAITANAWSETTEYVTGNIVTYTNYACMAHYVATGNSTAEVPDDNTDYWRRLPYRNPALIVTLVDISLYHIHSRLDPMSIPTIRIDRYKAAMDMLKAIQAGSMSPCLPPLPTTTSNPSDGYIMWGSNRKLRF